MAKKPEYGNDSISMLKGADRVRKKPQVIFGSDNLEGCIHSFFEILSNSIDEAREGYGDKIIVTGDIGRHGCTILLARNEFKIDADVTSDCAPLNKNVKAMLDVTKDIHVIRDATRGGVGTVLYEIAGESNVGISLDQENIPVADGVRGVCGMLGLEPLYLACEGRLVVFAPASEADSIVEALRACPNSEGACIIGEVTEENKGKVVVNTAVGAKTMLSRPSGELLPRIC